jgi:hypothetical protein
MGHDLASTKRELRDRLWNIFQQKGALMIAKWGE